MTTLSIASRILDEVWNQFQMVPYSIASGTPERPLIQWNEPRRLLALPMLPFGSSAPAPITKSHSIHWDVCANERGPLPDNAGLFKLNANSPARCWWYFNGVVVVES